MKKRFRIRNHLEFQRLYQEGRSFANKAAVLYVMQGKCATARVGFAAGRKLGKAVVRNRVKRRMREAVRQLWPQVRPGVELLVIARAGALAMDFVEIRRRIADLLQRARVLAAEGRLDTSRDGKKERPGKEPPRTTDGPQGCGGGADRH